MTPDASVEVAASPPAAPRLPVWIYLAALGIVSAVSRLPQLLSPNLLLDGDECTLGLMARHLAQARAFPIFFPGQHYGLSSIEAAAGALSFVFFGAGPLPLKAAMLALWTVGVLFLFLAMAKILGANRSFWIASVLLLTPAWAVWSMKARGGYITAFTAAAVLLWLLTQDEGRRPVAQWLAAGALTSVIYLAQPLWLPGVLPIVAVVLISRRRMASAVAYVSLPAATFLLLRTSGGPALGNSALGASLPGIAHQIYVNLTGAYYLWWAVDVPGPATRILSLVWCAVLAGVVLVQLYRLLARRYCLPSHLLFLSAFSTLFAEWILLRARDGRYLLPFSGILVLLAGVELLDLVDRRVLSKRTAAGITLAVLLLGSASMGEFRHFTYLWKNPPNSLSETRRLRQVINYAEARGVRHVFSMNGLLEWQLMFYSDERLLARYQAAGDRDPAYIREVDRALDDGEPVAVVGYTDASGAPGCSDVPICTGGIEGLVPNPREIMTVDGKYFVYVGADRALLEQLHFRLAPPRAR